MLYREIIAVCSEIHTKHINTVCGQNVELLNVKLAVHIVTTGLWRVNPEIWKLTSDALHTYKEDLCQCVLHLTLTRKVSAVWPCLALSVTFHYGYRHSQTFTNLNARLAINPNFTVPKTEGTLAQPSVRVGSCIRVGRIADCTGQGSYTDNIPIVSTSTGGRIRTRSFYLPFGAGIFFNFSTPVYKIWIIQEPNTLEL